MKLKSGLLICLALLAQTGCGPTTYEVSGTVKFDGEPVSEGQIAFVSEDGASGGTTITNGQYKVAVPSGKVKIQINATKLQKLPPGKKGMYGKTEEVRDYIPAKYNADTVLKEEITGPKELNFDLKSK